MWLEFGRVLFRSVAAGVAGVGARRDPDAGAAGEAAGAAGQERDEGVLLQGGGRIVEERAGVSVGHRGRGCGAGCWWAVVVGDPGSGGAGNREMATEAGGALRLRVVCDSNRAYRGRKS